MSTLTVTTEQVHELIEQLAAKTAAASITPEMVANIFEKMRQLNDQEKDKIIAITQAYLQELNQAGIVGFISRETTQSEEDNVIFETDDGTVVGNVGPNGADFSNLKRGGQQVARMIDLPTKDTSIGDSPSTTNVPTTKAVKDYVDAHSGGGYPIDTETTQSEDEELEFANDAGSQSYVKVGNYGLKSKAYLDMQGQSIIDSEVGDNPSTSHAPSAKAVKDFVEAHGGVGNLPISGKTETTTQVDDEVIVETDGGIEVLKITPEGLYAKRFFDLEGNEVGASVYDIVDIASSDKIGIFSTSFMNGYAMKNHHHLNHISMFLDYIIYNYGKSGDDEIENLVRLENDEPWLGTLPPSKWNIKYGIVMHKANSGALYSFNYDTAYFNSKLLANAIKSLGGTPIFSTEHTGDSEYWQGAVKLCEEEGYMFMDFAKKSAELCHNYFPPFWHNGGHPSTRTGWAIVHGMLPYLQSLPRPNKCVKLFRLRDTSINDVQSLIYNDIYTRCKNFIEISCGCKALTPETEKYFDRLDGADKRFNLEIQDEYQKLQQKTSVPFGNLFLAEFITPYDKSGIKSVSVSFVGTGITKAYVLKLRQISNPLSDLKYVAFGIVAGSENVHEGDTITISGISREDGVGLNGSYVVSGVINGMLVTSTISESTGDKKTSGEDTPTCSVSGITLVGSYSYYSYEYASEYNKPYGEFVEIPIVNNMITLDNHIDTMMDLDKFSIVFTGANISIFDIRAIVSGAKKKNIATIPLCNHKNGTSIITDCTFEDGTSWENVTSFTQYNNTETLSTVTSGEYENLPNNISVVRELSEGQIISQSIDSSKIVNSATDFSPVKVQVRVTARYFPRYIDSDEKWNNSEITESSFDVSKLTFLMNYNGHNVKAKDIYVGAWWNEFVFDLTVCHPSGLRKIALLASDKNTQIAKCEVIRINN